MAEVKIREEKPADALEVVERAETYAQQLRLSAIYTSSFSVATPSRA